MPAGLQNDHGESAPPTLREIFNRETSLPLAQMLRDGHAAFAPYLRLVEQVRVGLQPWLAAMRPWVEAFRTLAPLIEALPEQISARYRAALPTLGECGWYLDPELPSRTFVELADAIEADVERLLCEHIESRLTALEAKLAEDFPHRANAIRAAFKAHRAGEYLLSVPVLLAQADGISQDLTFPRAALEPKRGKAPLA
jgi:hypothetical protein